MNSQTTNSTSNKNEFSHYHESAEKMEKISSFFNKFFLANVLKAFAYFILMPGFIHNYTLGSIDITIAYIVSQIALSFASSYKEIYMNKTKLSHILIALMTLIDALSIAVFNDYITLLVSVAGIITEIAAQVKMSGLKKLKNLKGYPLFNELLDNPAYVFTAIPNLNVNLGSISINTPPPAISSINTGYYHYSKGSVQNSVKIPDIQTVEPEKVSLEEMTVEKPAEGKISNIPFPADTPMEARILGNATLDYSIFNIQTEEISVIADGIKQYADLSEIDYTDNRHKIINISKNKNNNL